VAKIVRVTISAVLLTVLALTLVSAPLAEAGNGPPPPDLTISKVGPPGKVEMSDANGPVKKKTLNDGNIVRICNELQNGNPVTLTVRDKNGQVVYTKILQQHECVDLVVGSPQLPSGANYKVGGGSFIINLDGSPGAILEAIFELDSLIGGEISSIDTAALLLAGAQNSAVWMAPLLAGAVGAAIIYIKKKRN